MFTAVMSEVWLINEQLSSDWLEGSLSLSLTHTHTQPNTESGTFRFILTGDWSVCVFFL